MERVEIGGRISELAKSQRIRAVDIARECPVSKAMAGFWLAGKNVPRSQNVERLSEFLGTTPRYILYGRGKGGLTLNGSNHDDVAVRFYESLRAATLSDEEEGLSGTTYLSGSILSRAKANAEEVMVVRASGDTMSPRIVDGTRVAINRSDTRVADGKIYAAEYGDLVRFWRISRLPGGKYCLSSDNDRYEDEIVPIEDVSIIGRAFNESTDL